MTENNEDRAHIDTDISPDLSHLAAPERPPSFSAVLPSELISLLDDAYLLFLLSTSPSKALPPGKSLASVLPRAVESLSTGNHDSHQSPKTNGNAKAVIEERVTDIVQKAFWDDAVECLSSPIPSVTIPRIAQLQIDLHESLAPILPLAHSSMQTLASPPSPTSAPLRSAAIHLRSVLSDLRARCAPIRDTEIDILLDTLSQDVSAEDLPRAVAMGFKGTLELAERMQGDLRDHTLDALPHAPEGELLLAMRAHARAREREVVQRVWGGLDHIKKSWRAWAHSIQMADGEPSKQKWRGKLVEALGTPVTISFDFPSHNHNYAHASYTTSNTLPAPFLVPFPILFYVQNLIEALVICASIRSLIPASPPSTTTNTPDPRSSLTQRVWILLRGEIDGGGPGSAEGAGETKIAHLEDEVVRAFKRARGPDAVMTGVEEDGLRAAVRRVLRVEDPVSKLLAARVLAFLRAPPAPAVIGEGAGPRHMRTGLVDGHPSAHAHQNGNGSGGQTNSEGLPTLRGFEEDVLREGLKEVRDTVDTVVDWAEWVWEDVIVA
ncbi:hypothetical protein BOTBODRAFT_25904 [Botryobasidium botryosum FD-172 SS1]|uniref:Uncharacterized protein n=1 Tax=Botryobasidium botryosum (strain FD-172 SS1) TaxID=930990 RepID=A0A067N0E0_BOTB1|nr:hypothetical protein BOTBODRAFT_25904 [Botryobasidium botryosum FD-172 SS1]